MRIIYLILTTIVFFFSCLISLSSAVEGTDISSRYAPRNMAVPLTLLPRDKYGLIDWAESIRSGVISPIPSLDGSVDDDPLNLPVLIKSKKNFMTNVLFPHNIHTYWLSCKNCHPGIFVQKAGGNEEMTMWDILKGKYCGRCHGRVAFPLRECYRCHSERRPEEKTEEIKNE